MSRERVDLLLLEKEFTWDQEGWFVPLAMALEGVTVAQATWKPPGGGNSIWETLEHLNFYNERYLRRFTGRDPGPAPASNTATFALELNADAAVAWQVERQRAAQIAAELRAFLDGLTDEALEEMGDLGAKIPHLLLHDAYHTGQIVLLLKQQGGWPATRE